MTDRITKFIRSLDEKTKRQLQRKLQLLREDPFSTPGVKKMQGQENLYRLRMGKIRIIFQIIEKSVEIIDIDYRGNIY